MGSNDQKRSDLTTTDKRAQEAMIGKRISHFEILDVLGTGGMGVVYKARDTKLLRNVAIKVLSAEKTTVAQKRRFLQEARAASALNHRGIVAIYDFAEHDGVDFIVMEYVEGKSLAQRIPPGGFALHKAKAYALEIAEAMKAAHDAGIVHRDLKPQNLMIDKEGRIKILDFGIAKLNPVAEFDMQAQTISKSLTGAGAVIGTLAYMSPEQALGDPVDKRSDIFSFGIVLFEMLTGRHPFEADDESSVLHKLHFDDPEPVTALREEIPGHLELAVRRALAKRPQDRPQSMAEVCRSLQGDSDEGVRDSDLEATRDLGPKNADGKVGEHANETALSKVFITLAKKPKRSIFAVLMVVLMLAVATAFALIRVFGVSADKPAMAGEDHLLVLPFENIGDDKELETECVGLTESLTNGLSQVQELRDSLKVVPAAEVRQSGVKSAAEAAEKFGAGLVLAGSLQPQEDHVRMNLSLVKGATQLAAATGLVSKEELDSLERQALLKTVGLLRRQFDTFVETKSTIDPKAKKGAREFFKEGIGLLGEYVKRPDKKDNIDKAIESFQRAQALDPNYAPAYAGISRAYWRKYEDNEDPMWIEQAEQTARRAVELDPNLALAKVRLALALIQKNKDIEAEKELEQALILDPYSAYAYEGLAQVWRLRKNYEKAEKYRKDALNLDPNNRDLLDSLGDLYYSNGDYTKAEEVFLKSVTVAPESFLGHNSLAGVYYMQGKFSEAASQWQRALEIKPDYILYSNLGFLYISQNRYDKAVESLEKAVSFEGGANDYRVWANLAYAYDKIPDNQAKALDAYRVGIKLTSDKLKTDADDAELHCFLAFFLAKIGEFEDSLREIEKIPMGDEKNPEIHYRNALTFEIAGKRKSALDSLETAMKGRFPIENIVASPELLELRKDPKYHKLVASYYKDKDDKSDN